MLASMTDAGIMGRLQIAREGCRVRRVLDLQLDQSLDSLPPTLPQEVFVGVVD